MTGPLIGVVGAHAHISCDEYFAEPCPAPALTHSGLKLLTPRGAAPAKFAYHHPAIGQPAEERKSTQAQYRGKLVHRLALGKGQDYAVSPYDRYQSNEAKEWKEATEKAGLMPVKQTALGDAQAMADVIKRRIDEATQGQPYETEVVIAWQEETSLGPIWCRAMLDVWCPSLLLALDVKTCKDASDDAIQRQFANGYATQDSWYRRGINKVTNEPGRAQFRFLFVEDEAPFLSRKATPREAFRHIADHEIRRGIAIFSDCLHAGKWPEYQDAAIEPPGWLVSRLSAQEFMGDDE